MATYSTKQSVPLPPVQKSTSITAHVVRMASVNMSFAELDVIAGILARVATNETYEPNLTSGEMTILDEFIQAVESLR